MAIFESLAPLWMGEKQHSKRSDDRDLFHKNVGMQSGQTPDQINKQTNKN